MDLAQRLVIGTEGTFPQSFFTSQLRLNWTKLFFLGNSQILESMKIPSLRDDDVGLRKESRFTTTMYSKLVIWNFTHQSKAGFDIP